MTAEEKNQLEKETEEKREGRLEQRRTHFMEVRALKCHEQREAS